MALDTRSLVKVALAAVVLFALYKLVMDKSSCGGGRGGWERYSEAEAEADQAYAEQMDETQYYMPEPEPMYEETYGEQSYDAPYGDYEQSYDTSYDNDTSYDTSNDTSYDQQQPADGDMETYADLGEAMPPVTSQMWGAATDLLPKPSVAQANFGEFAPSDALRGANFLDPVKFIGVDTQGSSLRNANYDLRSSLPIKKATVSPWLNSSYEPDLMRRPLE